MKNFFLLLSLVIFTNCIGNTKSDSSNTSHSHQSDSTGGITDKTINILSEESKLTVSGRRIFYPAYKLNSRGDYYIDKVGFCMLYQPDIFFLDFGMEPSAHRISSASGHGDVLINLEFDAYSSEYYREKFLDNDFTMYWTENNENYPKGARMEKNPNTLIWTIYLIHADGQEYEYQQAIESKDIIPSGHRYVNMETRRHDTNNEVVDWMPAPLPPSVLTSHMSYITRLVTDPDLVDDPESFQPFLGTWVLLEEADQGYVVYNRQEEGGNDFIPTTLRIEGDSLTYTSYWETFSMSFDEIRYYEDGTVLVCKSNGDRYQSIYAMKWEDRSKGLAYWSLYYGDGRRIDNELYVREEMNTYPVYDYDELSMYIE